jgi:hypothetical protein
MNYGVILNELIGNIYSSYQYNTIIWLFFNFNFGITGPLFSGVLAIAAGKYSKRFRS